VGGVDHSPAGPFDCPSAGEEGSKKMWIVAVVVIPFILIVFRRLSFCLASSVFAGEFGWQLMLVIAQLNERKANG
jgi:hypothetical protein